MRKKTMPNAPVRAAAEGLPGFPQLSPRLAFLRKLLALSDTPADQPQSEAQQEKIMNQQINRRTMFSASTAIAAIPVMGGAGTALAHTDACGGDETLFALLREHENATAEMALAIEERDWIAAEWRHLWPLAPEEILGGTNAHTRGHAKAECDLAGKCLMRECAPLTKRLSRDFRKNNEVQCFTVETPEDIEERLAFRRARKIRGRSAKGLARNRRRQAADLRRLRRSLVLARQYEAETKRIREISGIERAKQRIVDVRNSRTRIKNEILVYPAATAEGVAAKADFFLTDYADLAQLSGTSGPLAFGFRLAADVKRVGMAVQS
jgi:hypothetical protein